MRISSIEPFDFETGKYFDFQKTHQALCMAKISAHYFTNRAELSASAIRKIMAVLKDIPAIILHGRYDMLCQLSVADNLTQAWPNATLQILPKAGHGGFEKQTIDAFCHASSSMADFLNEK